MTAYLPNRRNLVRTATLTASSLLPSTAIRRTDTAEKAGGGRVTLGGAYTGASDASLDVEVLDNGGSTPAVSKPVFRGVGSGELADLSVDPGVSAQIFTVTLEDLGTVTRQAYAPFQSATLRARDSGPDGNLITLTVDATGLTYTATGFAVRNDMQAGVAEFVGDQYNFGASTLNVDGTLPESAPRISFGDDPQVYRPWRKYVAGRYVYGFSPALVRDVPAGVKVKAVTGSRTVTITDGTTTDTLTGVVTLYDCLRKIRDDSTLVEVDGVIVNDLQPNGQAAVDLSVWTQPYVARTLREGTDYIRLAEVPISVDESAPTEVLEIQCTDVSVPGREVWRVYGQASNRLADAITGELYDAGGYSFRIPRPAASESSTARATVRVEFHRPNWDGISSMPGVAFTDVTLGPAAVNGKRVFTYQPKPKPDCDPDLGEIVGALNPDCIGLIPEEEEIVTTESRKRRLQRLADWLQSFIQSNTGKPSGPFASVDQDIAYARRAAKVLQDCLGGLYKADAVLSWSAWQALTAYPVDGVIEHDGFRFAANTAGTSGASEPTWPTTVGDTVTDGGVTWENIGKVPLAMWDAVFDTLRADAEELHGLGAQAWFESWARSTRFNRGDVIIYDGFLYVALNTGTTRQQPYVGDPAWPTTVGETVYETQFEGGAGGETATTPGITWMCLGPPPPQWASSTARAVGDRIRAFLPRSTSNPTGEHIWALFQCTVAGTSGSTQPTWPTAAGDTVVDGGVTWVRMGGNMTPMGPVKDAYYERYISACGAVLAAAEVAPDFDDASGQGDGCWRDIPDAAYWWASTDDYAPIFSNRFYHSARLLSSGRGELVAETTREFAFGPQVGCPELLQVGDQIIVTINGVNGVQTYQPGDLIVADITRATEVEFGGGQTGNDTLTFSVVGSIDGRLLDYELYTPVPVPYDDGGVSFQVAPGGIDFALGDAWTFAVEGGRFRWRKDGGTWSSAVDIDAASPVSLGDGLNAVFSAGSAPSWVPGDRWTFSALAVNGPDQLRQPSPEAFAWASSQQLVITPASASPVEGLLIAEHGIPEGATITLEGSDDNFVSTPLNTAVPWATRSIWLPLSGSYAKYRLTINQGGSIRWLWLAEPLEAAMRGGGVELGRAVRRHRLPGLGRRSALSLSVEHSALSQSSVDTLLAAFDHAAEVDESLLGVLLGGAAPLAAIVRLADAPIEIADVFEYHPTDAANRLLSLSVELEPVS